MKKQLKWNYRVTYVLLLELLPKAQTNHMYSVFTKVSSTNQRNSEGEEPGIDEKIVPTDLDDVQEQ